MLRLDHELPRATAQWGWRFHHLGIPTRTIQPYEVYLKEYKMYISGFESSPYGIEWMRFETDSPISDIIQSVPHLAFVVEDLEAALVGKEQIGDITSPSKGIRVAMILDGGAPIELLEFDHTALSRNND